MGWLDAYLEDLLYEGKFFPSSENQVILNPILEMAGKRQGWIDTSAITYNKANYFNNKKHLEIDEKIEEFIQKRILYHELKDVYSILTPD